MDGALHSTREPEIMKSKLLRLIDELERQKYTGPMTINWKSGEIKGGKTENQF